jgi:hypothetical protein
MDNLNLENPEYVDKLENVEKADIIKENVEKILEFCLLKENRTLRRENMDAYKQKCMREFTFMHQKYPTLFFSLIENPTTFPIYRLEEMLSLKKRIETTELTTENASVRVGQQYYDEFIKDTVTELDKKIK